MIVREIDGDKRETLRFEEYVTKETKEKLSQENASQYEIFDRINSTLDNFIEKLGRDDMDMPWDMDMKLVDNMGEEIVYEDMGDSELVDQVHVGDPVENEMTKDNAIGGSSSHVTIRRPRKRKRVKLDETALWYAPIKNTRKRDD
nr:hypothetical protein [Tanacetum cinerariifolium]